LLVIENNNDKGLLNATLYTDIFGIEADAEQCVRLMADANTQWQQVLACLMVDFLAVTDDAQNHPARGEPGASRRNFSNPANSREYLQIPGEYRKLLL
jgi:hypothetical protein